jgi:hypothetical protein
MRRVQAILSADLSSEQRVDMLRGLPAYVRTVQRDLRAGLEEGLVAGEHNVHKTLRVLDGWLATPSELDYEASIDHEMQLWAFPALRQYRDLLQHDVLPAARHRPGLHSLRGGERCYAAVVARVLGPSWSADRLRRVSDASISRSRQRLAELGQRLERPPRDPTEVPSAAAGARRLGAPLAAGRRWAATTWRSAAKLVGLDTIERPKVAAMVDDGPVLVRWERDSNTVRVRTDVVGAVLIEPLLAAGGFPGAAAADQAAGTTFSAPHFAHLRHVATERGWQLYAATLVEENDLYAAPDSDIGVAWLRLRAATEARADVGVHDEGWSLERTTEFLVSTGGFSVEFAEGAAEEIATHPAFHAATLAGFVDLRTARRVREDLPTADFHHRLLRFGPLPIDLTTSADVF